MADGGGPWPAMRLPENIDAEAGLIGALLHGGRDALLDELTADDFATLDHRAIVAAMLDVRAARRPIDLATVVERLGPAFRDALLAFADAVVSPANAPEYLRIVVETATRRRQAILAGRIAEAAVCGDDPASLIAELAELRTAPVAGGERFDGDDVAALLVDPIPPREWLLERHLCRGFVTVVSAAGATGKTSLLIGWAISLATGRNLLGSRPHHRLRVLIVTAEDSIEELLRRIKAACLRYDIDPADVDGWLRIKALAGQNVTFATLTSAGDMAESTVTGELIAAARRNRFDVVVLDPFVKLSGAPENDNNATDFVCKLLSRIAEQANAAVAVAHHHRKGAATPGDTDSARGAKSLIDAARVGLTLTRMSTEEAKTFEVPERDRWQIVRLDDGKANLAPAGATRWFRLASVHLDNGTPDYPDGDTVQVIEAWTPPDAFEDMSTHIAREIILAIDAAEGLPEGERYTDRKDGGDRWAGRLVRERAGKSEADAKRILATWINGGVLRIEKYTNRDRKARNGLIADRGKLPGDIAL